MIVQSSERRVLTYGTFDQFHVGHARFLRRLTSFGDRLIVGLATDDFSARKGKPAVTSFEERREVLLACRYVDHVISETDWDQMRTDIVNYDVSLLAAGDNYAGRYDDLRDLTQVLYLPRMNGPDAAALNDVPAVQYSENNVALGA